MTKTPITFKIYSLLESISSKVDFCNISLPLNLKDTWSCRYTKLCLCHALLVSLVKGAYMSVEIFAKRKYKRLPLDNTS
jgi:hypothetical protein